jgi:hypothetical protein
MLEGAQCRRLVNNEQLGAGNAGEVAAPATVNAGIDGETAELSGPLRFATRPASLRVRISRHHPGASPSARFLAEGKRQG